MSDVRMEKNPGSSIFLLKTSHGSARILKATMKQHEEILSGIVRARSILLNIKMDMLIRQL